MASGAGETEERWEVLVVAPHPDDAEIGVGGILLRLQAAGVRCGVLVLTDGERATRQPARGTRRDEGIAALAAYGLPSVWAGLPDGGLAEIPQQLAECLAAEATRRLPRAVLAPHPGDPHPDHAAAGAAAARLLGPAVWHWLAPGQKLRPSHLVPIDTVFERKLAWIRRHASQIPGPGESRAHLPGGLDILERAKERDLAFGPLAGCRAAEPLVLRGGGGPPVVLADPRELSGGARRSGREGRGR